VKKGLNTEFSNYTPDTPVGAPNYKEETDPASYKYGNYNVLNGVERLPEQGNNTVSIVDSTTCNNDYIVSDPLKVPKNNYTFVLDSNGNKKIYYDGLPRSNGYSLFGDFNINGQENCVNIVNTIDNLGVSNYSVNITNSYTAGLPFTNRCGSLANDYTTTPILDATGKPILDANGNPKMKYSDELYMLTSQSENISNSNKLDFDTSIYIAPLDYKRVDYSNENMKTRKCFVFNNDQNGNITVKNISCSLDGIASLKPINDQYYGYADLEVNDISTKSNVNNYIVGKIKYGNINLNGQQYCLSVETNGTKLTPNIYAGACPVLMTTDNQKCDKLGIPDDSNTLRLYSTDECVNKLNGSSNAADAYNRGIQKEVNGVSYGECLNIQGGSYSWDCRGVNNEYFGNVKSERKSRKIEHFKSNNNLKCKHNY